MLISILLVKQNMNYDSLTNYMLSSYAHRYSI
nr:MAG TPA: hypothetical protein [Caudoviricetes sp.]